MSNPNLSPYADQMSRFALPQFCTPLDVALALGLGEATVRRHLRCGALPGRKLGSRWVIERDTLIEWLRPGRPRLV